MNHYHQIAREIIEIVKADTLRGGWTYMDVIDKAIKQTHIIGSMLEEPERRIPPFTKTPRFENIWRL